LEVSQSESGFGQGFGVDLKGENLANGPQSTVHRQL
jgi:hypothetical protein